MEIYSSRILKMSGRILTKPLRSRVKLRIGNGGDIHFIFLDKQVDDR